METLHAPRVHAESVRRRAPRAGRHWRMADGEGSANPRTGHAHRPLPPGQNGGTRRDAVREAMRAGKRFKTPAIPAKFPVKKASDPDAAVVIHGMIWLSARLSHLMTALNLRP